MNEHLATCALETLAVARRPLSILELGWAVALVDPVIESQSLSQLESCVDAVRVLNLLQPFLLRIDFENHKKRQVMLDRRTRWVYMFVLYGGRCGSGLDCQYTRSCNS